MTLIVLAIWLTLGRVTGRPVRVPRGCSGWERPLGEGPC